MVGKVYIRKKIYYLVKWTGWPSEYNQWVPDKHMDNAKDVIRKFVRTKRGRKAKKKLNEPLRKARRYSKH